MDSAVKSIIYHYVQNKEDELPLELRQFIYEQDFDSHINDEIGDCELFNDTYEGIELVEILINNSFIKVKMQGNIQSN